MNLLLALLVLKNLRQITKSLLMSTLRSIPAMIQKAAQDL